VSRYCTVEDLRAEGVTEAQASDERLLILIEEASATIDRLTGWFFEPRALVLRLEGRGTPSLEPRFPPIAIGRIGMSFETLPLDAEHLLVVGAPVDPDFVAPRITRLRGVFTRGYGNVVIEGMWGYTEPDGTPMGRTPLAIRRACMMLVMDLLPRVADVDAWEDVRIRARILSERTRDQSYTLSPPARTEELTGNAAVDAILFRYQRPMGLGAA
jgi:hypothetical protein